MWYVYKLIDYKGYPFYIGLTKNLEIRVREHEQNKNATPAKTYRVRRSIETYGHLKFIVNEFPGKLEAVKFEAEQIQLYHHQLVNKTHGKVKKEAQQRRTKGRSNQCPQCGNWFKRIKAHRCKVTQKSF